MTHRRYRPFLSLLVVAVALGLAASSFALKDPPKGKVTIAIVCDDSGDGNRKPRLRDLEESARHLEIRMNDADWIAAFDAEEDTTEKADIVFTILDRKKEDERGLVLTYELRSGAYRQKDEFAYAGGGVGGGGIRSLSFNGDNGGVREQVSSLGWPYLAEKLVKQLDEFAELNYELIVGQRRK